MCTIVAIVTQVLFLWFAFVVHTNTYIYVYLQEAASAKELKELRGHNEALKRSCRDSEDAAARRVAESESQRAASDSAARHATAKVMFF